MSTFMVEIKQRCSNDLLKCQSPAPTISHDNYSKHLKTDSNKHFLKSFPKGSKTLASGWPSAWSGRWGSGAVVVFTGLVAGKIGRELLIFNWFYMTYHQLSLGLSCHGFLQTAWMVFFCVWSTASCHCFFSDADSEFQILKKVWRRISLRLFKQFFEGQSSRQSWPDNLSLTCNHFKWCHQE